MGRTTKAIERISFAIFDAMFDALSMLLLACVHVVKYQMWVCEGFLLEYRTKRGYRFDQFEQKMEDWQYEKMATQLKMTEWERGCAEKLGERIVLEVENFPNLSRRQARRVMEYWRILRKVYRKPRKYVRDLSA